MITFKPPSLAEVKLEAAKAGLTEAAAVRFYDTYSALDWRLGKHNLPIRSWRHLLSAWVAAYRIANPLRLYSVAWEKYRLAEFELSQLLTETKPNERTPEVKKRISQLRRTLRLLKPKVTNGQIPKT